MLKDLNWFIIFYSEEKKKSWNIIDVVIKCFFTVVYDIRKFNRAWFSSVYKKVEAVDNLKSFRLVLRFLIQEGGSAYECHLLTDAHWTSRRDALNDYFSLFLWLQNFHLLDVWNPWFNMVWKNIKNRFDSASKYFYSY